METVLVLLGSMALVFLAAVIFVNAIEYIGFRLRLGGSFVGAIIAPLFTSFPEMTVFLVALFAHGGEAGEKIGIGTVFGQPFMASSFSFGLVGLMVLIGFLLGRRDDTVLEVDRVLIIPFAVINICFPLVLIPAIWPGEALRHFMGFVFVAAFIIYIWIMYRKKRVEIIEDAAEPYVCRVIPQSLEAPLPWAFVQSVGATVLLYIGSHAMVGSVDLLARGLGISPLGLAIIIVPAATAIPETSTALIWSFRGKDTLSVASLVGENALYSTFYPALGMFLTTWALDVHAYLSVAANVVISLIILYFLVIRRLPWWGLCLGFIFFTAYAILVFAYHI